MARKTYTALGRVDASTGRVKPGGTFTVDETEGGALVALGMAVEASDKSSVHGDRRVAILEVTAGMTVPAVLDLLVEHGVLVARDRAILDDTIAILAAAPLSAEAALAMLHERALLLDGEFDRVANALLAPAPEPEPPPLDPEPPPPDPEPAGKPPKQQKTP